MQPEIEEVIAALDVFFVFAAVASLLLVVHGLTRRRDVLTASGQHLVTFASAWLAYVVVGRWVELVVTLDEIPDVVSMGSESDSLRDFARSASLIVLMSVVTMAVMAERATILTHSLLAFLVGLAIWPLSQRAVIHGELWDRLELPARSFHDPTGLLMVGAGGVGLGLAGVMILGPRLGRFGSNRQPRVIPGASLSVAVVGALFFTLAISMHAALNASTLSDAETPLLAPLIVGLTGASAGSATAGLLGRIVHGVVGSTSLIRGALAGVVASTTAFHDASGVLWALGIGGAAGATAVLLWWLMVRSKIDDPAGVLATFASAVVWAAAATSANASDQLIGVGLVFAFAFVLGAVLFGLLRVSRSLRLDPAREIAGLIPE